MLTPRENFLETIRGGSPDRYVNQYEALGMIMQPIGGSGAGKTRFYAKPNLMQCNTSYVLTDPKGGATRS